MQTSTSPHFNNMHLSNTASIIYHPSVIYHFITITSSFSTFITIIIHHCNHHHHPSFVIHHSSSSSVTTSTYSYLNTSYAILLLQYLLESLGSFLLYLIQASNMIEVHHYTIYVYHNKHHVSFHDCDLNTDMQHNIHDASVITMCMHMYVIVSASDVCVCMYV